VKILSALSLLREVDRAFHRAMSNLLGFADII
jgi:hypothetical protein